VRLGLKVVVQNDGDFVNAILLYTVYRFHQICGTPKFIKTQYDSVTTIVTFYTIYPPCIQVSPSRQTKTVSESENPGATTRHYKVLHQSLYSVITKQVIPWK
jgi:hypothetical protein